MLVAELYQKGLTLYYKLCVTGHCNKDYTIAATDVYLFSHSDQLYDCLEEV